MSGNPKNEKFKKITSTRVDKITDLLRLIGNCSNKNNYSYTKEEAAELFDKIEQSLNNAKRKYDILENENSLCAFKNNFEKGYTWINGFMRNVSRFPDKPALICSHSEEIISYEKLNKKVNLLSNALLKHGVKKGDKILYQMTNRPEFIIIYTACQKIGAIGCPLYMNLPPSQTAEIIDFTKPKFIIYEHNGDMELAIKISSYSESVLTVIDYPKSKKMLSNHITFESLMNNCNDSEPQPIEPLTIYDITTYFFTSGTTGKPKCVPVTSINEVLSAHDAMIHLSLKSTDRLLNLNPWSHRGSLHAAGPSTALYIGATAVTLSNLDASDCLKNIEKNKISFVSCTPTDLKNLADEQETAEKNLSTIRGIVSLGSPLNVQDALRYRKLLSKNIFNGYGTTETFWNTILTPESAYFYPKSVGASCLDDDVRIVKMYSSRDGNPNDTVKRDGKAIGEIIVKSLAKSCGFYISSSKQGSHYHKGYLYTHDIGTWDENGIITVIGRRDDMVIQSEEKIYTTQIEEFLISHPKVEDCIVTPVSDKSGKIFLAAYIVKSDNSLTMEELDEFFRQSTSVSKNARPQFMRFKKVLPKTPTGKHQRKKAAQTAAHDLKNGLFYSVK